MVPKNNSQNSRSGKMSSRSHSRRHKNSGSSVLGVPKSINTREKIHSFERVASQSIVLNQQAWLTSSGVNDLEINFSLQYTNFLLGGVSSYTVSNPGYSEFVALFEKWRIRRVDVTPMFSANNSGTNTASNGLPVMNVVVDYDDSAAISLVQAQQYSNLRVVLLGNGAQPPPTFSLVPKALLSTSVGSGTVMMSNGQWLNTQSPTTIHYGIKFVYDNSGLSSTASIGNVNFYIRYYFDFFVAN